jgi:uncharacterized protein (DUF1501 family)
MATKTRRNFLRSIGTLGAAGCGAGFTRLGLISANAQSSTGYRALVCVFLFGGNDSNNTIVPLDSVRYAKYAAGRGPLALAQGALLPVSAKGGAETYGFHPQLAGLRALYQQRKLAAVLNVGTLVRPVTKADIRSGAPVPRNLYSHSDQTQQWQTSNPLGGGTGWGGRAADLIAGYNMGILPPGISVNGNSLLLTGNTTRGINVSPGSRFGLDSFGSTDGQRARDAASQQILRFDSGVTMIAAASGVLGQAMSASAAVNDALASAPPLATVFPQSGLGNQLSQVARIISARHGLGMARQIFFAGMGGFDNHNDLLPSHNSLLATVNAAISSFAAAMQELGVYNDVTLFTESEFSRTFNSNTGNGSDHAWGGHHLVTGGAVNGGEMYGSLPELDLRGPDDAGDRGLWIPKLSLDQYGATLAQWFGVRPLDLPLVFPNLPNFSSPTIPFLG